MKFHKLFAYVHKEVDISQDMSHVESAMSFYIGLETIVTIHIYFAFTQTILSIEKASCN